MITTMINEKRVLTDIISTAMENHGRFTASLKIVSKRNTTVYPGGLSNRQEALAVSEIVRLFSVVQHVLHIHVCSIHM